MVDIRGCLNPCSHKINPLFNNEDCEMSLMTQRKDNRENEFRCRGLCGGGDVDSNGGAEVELLQGQVSWRVRKMRFSSYGNLI